MIVKAIVFSAAWGIGAMFYGLDIVRVGIVVSLTAADGALWPLFQNHRDLLLTPEVGVLVLAKAGAPRCKAAG